MSLRGGRPFQPEFAAVLFLAAAVSWSGCSDSATDPRPGTDPVARFDRVWSDFDSLYSFFVVKDIDWQASRARYRSRVDATTTSAELFDVLRQMLGELEDPHVFLEGPGSGPWTYTGWYDRYPSNFDLDLVEARFGDALRWSPAGRMLWGWATPQIAYVHIPSFGGSAWEQDLEALGPALSDAAALVIDIRDNVGGNDGNGRMIARRINDQRRLFRIVRWRNGPAHDDFDPPIEDYLSFVSGGGFRGPVAVLTNRKVVSSAEGFLLMMRAIPTVTVVGDTTGGGSANPEVRSLPGGWRYTISRWWVQTPEGESFEGVGLGPDVFQEITAADLEAGRDAILERALEILEAELAQGS